MKLAESNPINYDACIYANGIDRVGVYDYFEDKIRRTFVFFEDKPSAITFLERQSYAAKCLENEAEKLAIGSRERYDMWRAASLCWLNVQNLPHAIKAFERMNEDGVAGPYKPSGQFTCDWADNEVYKQLLERRDEIPVCSG